MDREVTSKMSHVELLRMTTQIASSYVSNNDIPGSQIPDVIQSIFTSLSAQTRRAAAAAPVGIAWDGVGDRLLLFDAASTLFAITSDGPPRLLAVRDADELRSVEAIATYDGNLYVLDPEGGEVWRYLPAGGGYDSAPTRGSGRA